MSTPLRPLEALERMKAEGCSAAAIKEALAYGLSCHTIISHSMPIASSPPEVLAAAVHRVVPVLLEKYGSPERIREQAIEALTFYGPAAVEAYEAVCAEHLMRRSIDDFRARVQAPQVNVPVTIKKRRIASL